MMHYLKYNSILLLSFLMMMSSLSQAGTKKKESNEFTKTFDQTMDIKPFGKVDLSNQFGKIHITSTEGTQVKLHVDIVVKGSDEEKANKKLEKITINWSSASDWAKAETKVGSGKKGNEQFEINYTVEIPKTCTLNVENKFGDIYISGMDSQVKIDLSYGNLQAGRLFSENNRIDLAFSNADIELLGGGKLDIQYAESFQIRKAINLDLKSQFSKLSVEDVKKIIIDSQYDKIDIGKVEHMDADNQFTHLRIDNVSHSLDADHRYGSLKVREIANEFESINVDAQFSNVDLVFQSGVALSLDADVSFGNIDCPGEWGLKKSKSDGISQSCKGNVRSGKGEVSVDLSYGNLEMKEK